MKPFCERDFDVYGDFTSSLKSVSAVTVGVIALIGNSSGFPADLQLRLNFVPALIFSALEPAFVHHTMALVTPVVATCTFSATI